MFCKRNVASLVLGLTSVLTLSSGDLFGQCSGGGGGRGPVSAGSSPAPGSNLAYSSNPLASNYPSSTALMASQFQRQAAAIQSQVNTMIYQNAGRQRLARLAYQERVLPMRLARAEATRAARAERIAVRLRQQEEKLPRAPGISNVPYSLTSVVAK